MNKTEDAFAGFLSSWGIRPLPEHVHERRQGEIVKEG